MLTQVVYTSRPKFDLAEAEGRRTIDNIVAAARRNNSEIGVTGMLLVGPNRFAQILEGEAAAVGKTLRRILADPRHDAVQVMDMRLVPERRFEDWAMGVADKLPPLFAGLRTERSFETLTADDFLRLASAMQSDKG